MGFTYDEDVSTALAQVRLLATDTDGVNPIFTDLEIAAFLSLESSIVKRAAALALETIASQQALLLKKFTIADLTTDGPALAKSLSERAKTLREQAQQEETRGQGLFDWAEMVTNEFSFGERIVNEIRRQQG